MMLVIGRLFAQDTIFLKGQPKWQKSLSIVDHSFFFEETAFKPLTFEEVKKQVFTPYKPKDQQQKLSIRPLIIQWFKFTISNTSSKDSVSLKLGLSAHYFARLYNNKKIIALGGVYQTGLSPFENLGIPLSIPPLTTITYWARTEDRQNQLVPSNILLDTPFTYMDTNARERFRDRYLFMLLSAIAGCLFFISVYAIYQYYLYKSAAFIWYISYTIASLITTLFWIDIRIGMQLFPPIIHDLVLSVFIYLIPVLYSFFIGSMLQLPIHFKKGWMIVKGLVMIAILQMIIEFTQIRYGWFPFNPAYYGLFVSVVPVAILHIVLLSLSALSKDAAKWFLFVGLMSLLLLWCLPLTGIFGLLPYKSTALFMIIIFIPAFLLLGLTIEAICFSFALSYRAKLVLLEKNRLQESYASQLAGDLYIKTKELEIKSRLHEEQKIKHVQTEFEQKMAETEMKALRAQMNPHFIFNCLNSIKLYMLENNSQAASEYLTIFSQLIRVVLENSLLEKVTLQKELESLRLYIELEAMRFKNKVRYQIDTAPNVEAQYIEIPPLLIQPYVENAIWHGLMHKEDGGSLQIKITQPNEQLLQIEIADDGIGRERAAAYKSKSATRQKSFGLQMTAERLHIINQVYQAAAVVHITDLKDSANNATGTKVILQIPIDHA
jgi:sensor histidine kinase YesM